MVSQTVLERIAFKRADIEQQIATLQSKKPGEIKGFIGPAPVSKPAAIAFQQNRLVLLDQIMALDDTALEDRASQLLSALSPEHKTAWLADKFALADHIPAGKWLWDDEHDFHYRVELDLILTILGQTP